MDQLGQRGPSQARPTEPDSSLHQLSLVILPKLTAPASEQAPGQERIVCIELPVQTRFEFLWGKTVGTVRYQIVQSSRDEGIHLRGICEERVLADPGKRKNLIDEAKIDRL